MKLKVITNSPAETKKFGQVLAKDILSFDKLKTRNQAFVIGLIGELGGGKTTFLQGFAKGLHIRKRILSPTFVIMKSFKVPTKGSKSYKLKAKTFIHIDCYRIEDPKEILDLGFAGIIKNPENIVAIEWADKIKRILPKHALILKFRFLDKDKREVKTNTYPLVDNLPLDKVFESYKIK